MTEAETKTLEQRIYRLESLMSRVCQHLMTESKRVTKHQDLLKFLEDELLIFYGFDPDYKAPPTLTVLKGGKD